MSTITRRPHAPPAFDWRVLALVELRRGLVAFVKALDLVIAHYREQGPEGG